MRKLLLLLLLTSGFVNAQVVNIPDDSFKQELLNYNPRIDTNFDNEIQESEAAAVTELYLTSFATDITGLSAFTNLIRLDFYCYGVQSLNFNGLVHLEELVISTSYEAQSVNFSALVALKKLSLETVGTSMADLSMLSNLEWLTVEYGLSATPITFPAGNKLKFIELNQTPITTVDVSQLTGLEHLKIATGFSLNTLILPASSSTLKYLFLNSSSLGGLGTSFNASVFPALEYLNLADCYYGSLNASGLTHLATLNCSGNQLTSLNLAGSNNITELNASSNRLTTLDISNLTLLQFLDTSNNMELPTLNVSNSHNLTTLSCYGNALTALDISNNPNLQKLDFRFNQITSIDLNNHTALTELKSTSNPLTVIDVSQLPNLTVLDCYNNQLTALSVNMLTNLKTLECGYNPIQTLDISNLINLESLGCGSNQLAQLNILSNTKLKRLNCNSNTLTSLEIAHLPSLTDLNCEKNQITALDFSASPMLSNIAVNDNLFTTLDFTGVGGQYIYIHFENNPLLTYVNVKNLQNADTMFYNTSDCPSLAYVCANDADISYILRNLTFQGITNVQVNSYCSFAPGGVHNTITGNLTLDLDNNGCGAGDAYYPGIKILVNDGSATGATFTNVSGNYTFYTQSGNYTITPQLENAFFTATPASATVTFDELNGTTQTQNFCIAPVGIHKDLEIAIVSSQPARPGFDASYVITYKNKGNQTLSGTINLAFNDTVLDFISSNPATTSQSMGNLNWDFSNLQPFESRNITFTVNANGPMETPPVNINDLLNYTATISPAANDETPLDNVFTLSEMVTGSFDPNDKTCLEGTTIAPENIGKYVHYLIRFQNSGTAPAENVVIKDVIDTTKFDMASLQFTSASHPQTTKITGNKVEFYFQNINLPAEQDDEPGSHGFVAFKIKTNSNLVLGNTISNIADIFFDYNFPITTNPAESTFATLATNDFENTTVSLQPNPVTDKLHISAKDQITSIMVYDVQGRLIQTNIEHSNAVILDLSKQNGGVYFVKIQTEKGVKTEKIIKK